MNILVTHIYFILSITWSLAYGCGQQWNRRDTNAGKLTTISIAVAMERYDTGCIAQWSTSRASLEATGCRHRVSACVVSPRRPPWSTNTNKTHKTLTKHNFYYGTFRALVVCENFNPKTDPLLSSSMRRASCKYETPRLEPKSSRTYRRTRGVSPHPAILRLNSFWSKIVPRQN